MDPAKIYVLFSLANLAILDNVGLCVSSSQYSMNFSLEYGQLNISGRTIKSAFCLTAFKIIDVAFSMFFSLLSTTLI